MSVRQSLYKFMRDKYWRYLLPMQPESVSLEPWMDHLFGGEHRVLQEASVQKKGNLPGAYMLGVFTVRGCYPPDRAVVSGDALVIRGDSREGFIEVENTRTDKCFRMTPLEWQGFRSNCKPREGAWYGFLNYSGY